MSLPLPKFQRIHRLLGSSGQRLEPNFATRAEALGMPATGRDAILSRLREQDQEIPEHDLAEILDAFRHDGEFHRALMARRYLPATIIGRLVRLVARNDEINELLLRHMDSGSFPADLLSFRPRPNWWRQTLFPNDRA